MGVLAVVVQPLFNNLKAFTNTGFTSVILANGDLLENSPINKEWYHTYSIPYSEKPQQSLYTKIGFLDWTIWLIILICIIILNKKKETHA